MKPILPRLLVVLASLGLGLAIFEGAAYLYCRANGLGDRQTLRGAYAFTPVTLGDPFFTRQSDVHRQLHPYFGFVQRGESGINNAGFFSPHDYPYRKQDPSEFVIGIFGGSVAGHFAHEPMLQELAKTLNEKIPELKNRKIVFLSFGLGAHKQPQAFIIASYYSDSIDASLNIEGFNEISDQSGYPVFGPEYPQYSEFLYLPGTKSMTLLSRLYRLKEARDYWTELPQKKGALFHSYSYFLFWKALTGVFDRSIAKLHQDWKTEFHEFDDDEPVNYTREHYARDNVNLWRKFSTQQIKMMHALGKKAFVFIQPNQYVANSKPLTDVERKVALSRGDTFAHLVTRRYEYLLSQAKEMKAQGLPIQDLSDLFTNVQETLYIDDCCHFNKEGNLLMGQAIGRSIVANWRK